MSIPPVGKSDVNILTTGVPIRYNEFEKIPCFCLDLCSWREGLNLLHLISACLLQGSILVEFYSSLQSFNFDMRTIDNCESEPREDFFDQTD